MTAYTKGCFKGFVIRWVAVVTIILLATAGLNLLIDPYGLFDSPRHEDLNAIKPAAANRVRISKPHQVAKVAPLTLIAGNSRPEIGIDPQSACWRTAAQPIFNLSLPGSSLFMQARALQHAIAANEVKLVLWGLDLLDFLGDHQRARNPWRTPDKQVKFEHRLLVRSDGSENPAYHWRAAEDKFRALLSLNTTFDSLVTIASQQRKNSSTIRRDGFNPARDYLDIIAWEGQRVLFEQKNRELKSMFARPGLQLYAEGSDWSPRFESVRRLLQFADRQGVEVILFVNPYHADYLAAIWKTGHWQHFDAWKRRLTKLATEEAVALWDFSQLNELTSEPPPARGNKEAILRWFWEPAHYRRELGDLMLRRMLNSDCQEGTAQRVGVKLTQANVSHHLRQTELRARKLFSD